MALFRRAPKGRHALGAAVTSIPSGPLQELVAVPMTPPVVEAPSPPEPSWQQPAAEPHVMSSIAELIATGEAWSTEPPPPPAWREPVEVPAARSTVEEPVAFTAPEPVVPEAPAPVHLAPVLPVPEPPLHVTLAPVQLAPLPPVPMPVSPPAPVVPVRAALEAALADLLPQQPDGTGPVSPPLEAPLAPTPAATLVKLGFRDGSSTSLDPMSSQSRALLELAQTLTQRD